MNRLWVRLALMLLPLACLTLAIVGLLTHLLLDSGVPQYVGPNRLTATQIAALENYFMTNGSWQGVETLLNQNTFAAQGVQLIVTDANGQVVSASNANLTGVTIDHVDQARGVPLIVNGQRAGWLLERAVFSPSEPSIKKDNSFLAELTRWTVVFGLGAALLMLSTSLLSWIVARPLRDLTNAVQHLAAGELGKQVIVQGTAETKTLAEAFNTMSRDLAQGDALRRRIAADIAHELRTPMSVLRGHLEAMMDGLLPLDDEHLTVVYDQAIHLARLVEDLRLLTLAEARRLQLDFSTTTPEVLMAQIAEWFRPLALDAGLDLKQEVQAGLPPLRVDVMRMRQILNNLLTNALRHTPEGGEIVLSVKQCDQMVQFTVSNSGSKLRPEEINQIFTPFWRSDEARARDREGSGLGLAITQQLVALHGGQVGVRCESGWTHFHFEIPAAQN